MKFSRVMCLLFAFFTVFVSHGYSTTIRGVLSKESVEVHTVDGEVLKIKPVREGQFWTSRFGLWRHFFIVPQKEITIIPEEKVDSIFLNVPETTIIHSLFNPKEATIIDRLLYKDPVSFTIYDGLDLSHLLECRRNPDRPVASCIIEGKKLISFLFQKGYKVWGDKMKKIVCILVEAPKSNTLVCFSRDNATLF